jgi:undecaprenyl-phosphate 4-deoxy-4-formamido-L-arabinose transferase
MEQKKLISIVIPVYNGAETIKNLVEKIISVMKNRYQIEIILVNDYSTDSSEDVCFNLYQQHNHIVKFYS